MAKIPKEWPRSYLLMQYSAMRWLAKQGLTPEEIREFSWGSVDESTRMVEVNREVTFIKYDTKMKIGTTDTSMKTIKIPITGSGHEYFFLKSKIICFSWMFTEHPPKSWRKEKAREALFPLERVEWACRGLEIGGKQDNSSSKSLLTKMEKFGNLEVTKLNIANLERIEEAETK